jgi:hypothetical protein
VVIEFCRGRYGGGSVLLFWAAGAPALFPGGGWAPGAACRRGRGKGRHGQGRRHPVVHELGQSRPAVRAQQGHGVGQKAGGSSNSVQEEKGVMAVVLLVVRMA